MKKNLLRVVAIVLLVGVLATVFCACNAKTYTKKLEKAGYEVGEMDNAALEKIGYDVKWGIYAINADKPAEVCVIKFAKIKDAKSFVEEKTKSTLGLSLYKEDETIIRKSSIVIFGTKDGVKDAK